MSNRQRTYSHVQFQDLTGQTIHRLTFLRPLGKSKWLCRCACGKETEAYSYNVKSGATTSCGCAKRERLARLAVGAPTVEHHGEYHIWRNVLRRCLNAECDAFKHYGGRGITVCDRWRESFEAFMADMGPRPTPKHTIERKDNDGNYEPGNCIWATRKEQARNRRTNRHVTYEGQTKTVSEWADETGIERNTLRSRLRMGWDFAKAIGTPSTNPRKGLCPTPPSSSPSTTSPARS